MHLKLWYFSLCGQPEVTLDYKALLLLLNKKDDEDFLLGGKGYGVQCCSFCDAIRVRFHKI